VECGTHGGIWPLMGGGGWRKATQHIAALALLIQGAGWIISRAGGGTRCHRDGVADGGVCGESTNCENAFS
jgi:hypothetical protein